MKISLGASATYADLNPGNVFLAAVRDEEADNTAIAVCLKVDEGMFVAFRGTGLRLLMGGDLAVQRVVQLENSEFVPKGIGDGLELKYAGAGDLLYENDGVYLMLPDEVILHLPDCRLQKIEGARKEQLVLRSWQIIWDSWERPLFTWPPGS